MGPLFRLALVALIALPSIAIVNGCTPLHDRRMSLGWRRRKTRKSRSPGRRSRPRGAANSKPAPVIFRRLFPVDTIAAAQPRNRRGCARRITTHRSGWWKIFTPAAPPAIRSRSLSLNSGQATGRTPGGDGSRHDGCAARALRAAFEPGENSRARTIGRRPAGGTQKPARTLERRPGRTPGCQPRGSRARQ